MIRIKGKVEQSRERSSALPFSVVAFEKGILLVALDYGRQLYLFNTNNFPTDTFG